MKLRLGIIGLGQAGSHTVMKAVKHKNIEITAAADINEQYLNAFKKDFPDADVYLDLKDVLTSDRVDAVIATPTRLHKDHAVWAAEHKKHVLVEKPIARTLEEADAMIEAAQRNGVVLMVNHKRSYDPPIVKMREVIKSGEIGRVRMIHNWHYSDWLYRPRTPEELSDGGVVLRQGAHHFDMTRFLDCGKSQEFFKKNLEG
ncbi:MAG: Gfo/Idh/MocA family oxidoreductase [Paenibacillaceae bacterium]